MEAAPFLGGLTGRPSDPGPELGACSWGGGLAAGLQHWGEDGGRAAGALFGRREPRLVVRRWRPPVSGRGRKVKCPG